jgi:hypothetical protein
MATYDSPHDPTMQLFEHFQTALQVALAGHGLALVICNLTKTPKDDHIVGSAYKVIEVVAGIVTPYAKK